MKITRSRKPSLQVDMSPLIDCVFQLLIFFMLSSTFLTPAISLTLPEAESGEADQNQEIMVTISEEGKIFVNKDPVELDTLEAHLREKLSQSTKQTITLRGDEKMPYEYFVRALDAAERSGAIHVNVAHQNP
ncbi:Biopolymer transporter ExbD [Planctomycetales bacterium 10988]|nr:Biopolymer transporter ExbD [Planctomycetales bacterium 10988]